MLGVPLFQEQAMRLAMVAAGFTASEADGLRRAMAAWKRKGHLFESYGKKVVSGMLACSYTHAYALRCVEQLKGFSEYGFPESHAASFALLVYISSWLKCHHPAVFAAGLINSQPMGFYQPVQIVRDAREHGVAVEPVDVNKSQWNCTLEGAGDAARPTLRLGMRLVGGLRETEIQKVTTTVMEQGSFGHVTTLWRTSGVSVKTLRTLASADGFDSMGMDRQAALWMVSKLRDEVLPMFDAFEIEEASAPLPSVAMPTRVIYNYATTGLSLKAHPISFSRPLLNRYRVTPAGDLADDVRYPHGRRVAMAGIILIRQRPGTASGIVFVTLEDETGVANLVVRPVVYERWYKALRHSIWRT
jgi:error-prone DNA polymerase